MNIYKKSIIELGKWYTKQNEGFSETVYNDTRGYATIGFGHRVKYSDKTKIDYKTASELFDSEWDEYYNKLLSSPFFYVTPVRQVVLVDMAYNLGLNGLLSFKRMINAINSFDYYKAAAEILDSKYARQVGIRAKRNARLMESGQVIDIPVLPIKGLPKKLNDIIISRVSELKNTIKAIESETYYLETILEELNDIKRKE